MVADIGSVLFVDLLGMTMYPGSPFTGNIVRDAIQFLFIPSVFIILVLYILLGRLAAVGSKIRILIGVAAYLFIISAGYYKTFALLAGPYFIFLIFILGLLYFIPAHFGGGGAAHSGRSFRGNAGQSDASFLEGSGGSEGLGRRLYVLEQSKRSLDAAIKELQKDPTPDSRRELGTMLSKSAAMDAEIRILKGDIKYSPSARAAYLKEKHS